MAAQELSSEMAGLPPAQPGAASAEAPEDDGVFFVNLSFKGTLYPVPVQGEDSVGSIFDFVHEVLDFPQENCKLIHKGKMLRIDDADLTVEAAQLKAGAKVMLIATSAHDVAFVQSQRADPLVKGFDEEERDERNRRKRARAAMQSAWGTKQDGEWRFNSIKAEFKYSTPPPYEAEKLLQKLATDPGIIEIMKTRQFKVGILTEMSPVEAQERMANRGQPNMDLLGYNQNAGEMIVLRLRTDSLKGFRPYHDLVNTLLHELTHNVWGPHDHNFWKLFGELKAQYMRFHRFWSGGGRAADSNATGQFAGFAGDDDEAAGAEGGFGHALGGGAAASESERKARAARAAESRALGSGLPAMPNFLAGNGKWMVLCPCGQTHELGECPDGFEVSEDAAKAAEAQEGILAAAPPEADPMEGLAQDEAAPTLEVAEPMDADEAGPAVDADTDTAAYNGGEAAAPTVEFVDDAAVVVDASMPGPLPEYQAPGADDVDMPVASDFAAAAADVAAATDEPGAQEDCLGMDVAELEALGLDGANVWLARFSSQLGALRRSSRPACRTALELLLRMVRNVMESPHEQKFRRIKADNPKIKAELLGAGEEAETLIAMLGFEATVESGQRMFVLKDTTYDRVRLQLGKEMLEQELHARGSAVAAA